MKESEVLDLLAARYAEPRHVLLPHVANATGWKRQRVADAVIFELWPSDGLHLIGVEIKCHRSDWLREVARPIKREAVAQFCDQWIVVADVDVVKPAELRPGEGLMEVRASGLVTVVKPEDVEAQPVSREVLCAAVRRALACSPHGAAVKARAEELARIQVAQLRHDLAVAKSDLSRLRLQAKYPGGDR